MEEFFVGRDGFLDDLREGHARLVLLEGARGVGKSTVLRALEAAPPGDHAPLRIALDGVDSDRGLVERFVQHADLRRTRVEDWVSSFFGDGWSGDVWDELERLLKVRVRGPVVVLLDEVQLFLDLVARRDEGSARRHLARLDRLCRRTTEHRFVLTGSISMRAVARGLGVTLSQDWHPAKLPPLVQRWGTALFEHHHRGVCDDAAAERAWQITGGRPRWLIRLASVTPMTAGQRTTREAVDEGVERLLATRPFELDLGHLRRHPHHTALREALRLAAIEGATRATVLAGLQANLPRREAEDVLETLRDEFYLNDDAGHTLPLLADALRRSG